MGLDDLALLRRDHTRGVRYIELSTGATQWASDSVYVKDYVFAGLLNPEFEKVNLTFSFFGTADFNAQQLAPLALTLEDNKERLDTIASYEHFISFLSRPGVAYEMEAVLLKEFPDLKENWPQILEKLKALNRETIKLINAVRTSRKNLRVYGL